MMNAEDVVTYIISIAPAITAVVSIIASVIVAIKKTKSLNAETLTKLTEISKDMLDQTFETQKQNQDLKLELVQVIQDNMELKKQLRSITSKIKEK